MINLLTSGLFSLPKNSSKENQDSILLPKPLDDGFIMAVADGVGSYIGAKQASQAAVDYLSNIISSSQLADMNNVFSSIKEKVSELSFQNTEFFQAATTLTFCYIDSTSLRIGHIGDSRLYFKSGNKLRLLTKDHTQHQKLLDDKIFNRAELKLMSGKNTLTTAISKPINLEYQEISLPLDEVTDEQGIVTIFLMSDGAHHSWEKRPRFSSNTLNNPIRFAGSLQNRIEKSIPTDDYTLLAAGFRVR
ncbi:TPA: protein phosphatase 2C domain-containing protein [Yersinia enterocolitica]|uniref:PP2C family protein-serine/threonine phosphatase n=1 Tax=Yersinia sp. KBS0713 TaxID=1179669 RepID=UPI00110EC78D|nr:protein phosphatase 2C domain-containing protein [Yersinia sp. KBS0713]EKN6041452.1 serine/threonine-protein phosphatase [Yersinia enterocolitica]QDW33653.1 serine/threonine-protein phosphatase [Yersinia sp. KBS0713]HDM9018586.1 protein phosphatase 2C domain-containing protein [Yersinia enterocolitica]HDU2641967.1 protein phosphatase 2C domain-containing protein [Yersinia enterocolitica]HDW8053807.1 protein phosphatase 2C domain-containing protein [Yersinia enterocolitica]